jgi:hypothetical protein
MPPNVLWPEHVRVETLGHGGHVATAWPPLLLSTAEVKVGYSKADKHYDTDKKIESRRNAYEKY